MCLGVSWGNALPRGFSVTIKIFKMAASMKMNQLIKKREEIEAEIKALNEVLESVSCLH